MRLQRTSKGMPTNPLCQIKSEMDQLSLGITNQQDGEGLYEEVYALQRLELAFKKVRANHGVAQDGLEDSREERYELTVRGLPPGPHALRLSATDRPGNRQTRSVTVEVRR